MVIGQVEEYYDHTVNLGDDADTVGAIYGQLAGAYYGADAIPEDWKAKCSLFSLIEIFAAEIMKLADSIEPPDISTYRSIDWSAEYCPLVREKCELHNRINWFIINCFHSE